MNKALQIVNDRTGAIAVNGKFTITPVGLLVSGKPSFDDWCKFGHNLQKLERASQWSVGDWANYGEFRWGEKYAQGLDESGLDYGTFANYKWVAGTFGDFSCRHEKLSFEHHYQVSGKCYTPEQRDELLSIAEIKKLTREQFRKYLHEWNRARRIEELPPAPVSIGGVELDTITVCDISNIVLDDDSIDMIFTDPPYHDEYLPLYSKLAILAMKVLKPGAYCMAYIGKMFLPEIIDSMRGAGLEYIWQFIVFHPFSQSRITKHHIFENYRPILVFRKPGETNIREWVQDVVRGTRDKDAHDWQQDEDAPRQYIAAYTLPTEIVLDPFVGGGTTTAVCKAIGRHYIGFDKQEDAVRVSIERTNATKPETNTSQS